MIAALLITVLAAQEPPGGLQLPSATSNHTASTSVIQALVIQARRLTRDTGTFPK